MFLPPHKEKRLSKSEAKAVMKKLKACFLRNVYDFDVDETTSFWYVIKDSLSGIGELPVKTRNMVRRSLKTLEIRKISKDLMLEQGYEVYKEALDGYTEKPKVSSRLDFIYGIENNKEQVEYWGCILPEEGKLVAYAMNVVYDDMCEFASMKARPSYLKGYYPFYGLIYVMTDYYLNARKLSYVNDGARSVTNHSNFQPFLIDKFNFRKAYCHLQMHYLWWSGFAVSVFYPFRKWISVKAVRNFLRLEAMARGHI